MCKRLNYGTIFVGFWGLVFSGGTLCKRLDYSTIFVGIFLGLPFLGHMVFDNKGDLQICNNMLVHTVCLYQKGPFFPCFCS